MQLLETNTHGNPSNHLHLQCSINWELEKDGLSNHLCMRPPANLKNLLIVVLGINPRYNFLRCTISLPQSFEDQQISEDKVPRIEFVLPYLIRCH